MAVLAGFGVAVLGTGVAFGFRVFVGGFLAKLLLNCCSAGGIPWACAGMESRLLSTSEPMTMRSDVRRDVFIS